MCWIGIAVWVRSGSSRCDDQHKDLPEAEGSNWNEHSCVPYYKYLMFIRKALNCESGSAHVMVLQACMCEEGRRNEGQVRGVDKGKLLFDGRAVLEGQE